MSRLPLVAIALTLIVGCTGGDDDVGEESARPEAEPEGFAGRSVELALAGCERYWLRLRGELPTPDIPAPMVRAAVESALQRFLPEPGRIDPSFESIPDPDYVDPWGNVYTLELHSNGTARVLSGGPDGELGTEDDIPFPAMPEALEWQ